MALRGGGSGGGVVPFKAKRNKKDGRGEKLITMSQNRQKRRDQRLPWRCGIKGIKVRFKGKRARTPSLA